MPQLNSDALDDPIVMDAVPDFSGGMRSNSPAGNLEQNQYSLGINIDIKTKLAVTRRGTSSLGAPVASACQGLAWYSVPTDGSNPAFAYLVSINNAALYKYNEASWATFGSAVGAASEAQIGMAQLINKLYIASISKNLQSWDGASQVDLGDGTGDPTKPPKGCNLILSHTNRLWLSGQAIIPDGLWASQALAAGWANNYLMIQIGGGDGDPIIGIAPWDGYQIVVFKRNSIYIVAADPVLTAGDSTHTLSNATVTKISDVVGCVAARSICVVGADVWFLSDSGVRSVRRVLAQDQREISNAISEPINDVIERIDLGAASNCAAFFWDNKYMLSVGLDGATAPNAVLVFDTLRQAWSGIWTGWAVLQFALSKASGNERLNLGQPNGSVLRWLDYIPLDSENETTYEDAGVLIATEMDTRGMLFGDGYADKSGMQTEVVFYQSRANADLQLNFDQGVSQPLASGFLTAGGIPLLLPFDLPAIVDSTQIKRRAFSTRAFNRFREQQVVITSPMDKLAIRAVTSAAFPETLSPEQ